MKNIFYILFFLFPICIHAQVRDTVNTIYGYTDSLGKKQGKFQEKIFFDGYPDSLNCIVSYKDGALSGDCNCAYGTNNKTVTGHYVNNKKDGIWTFSQIDGIYHIIYYKNGRIEKQQFDLFKKNENGIGTIQKITYKDGKDRITKVEYYENSVLVKTHTTFSGRSKIDPPKNTMNVSGPWAITAGYTYQKSSWLELGIKKYSHLDDGDAFGIVQGLSYALVGAEINFDKQMQVAPKIGIGHYFTFSVLNCNLNCILYNDHFQKFYPAITPEIGFSLPYGIVQVDYGYNIFLTPVTGFMPPETHRLSIRINIPLLKTGH